MYSHFTSVIQDERITDRIIERHTLTVWIGLSQSLRQRPPSWNNLSTSQFCQDFFDTWELIVHWIDRRQWSLRHYMWFRIQYQPFSVILFEWCGGYYGEWVNTEEYQFELTAISSVVKDLFDIVLAMRLCHFLRLRALLHDNLNEVKRVLSNVRLSHELLVNEHTTYWRAAARSTVVLYKEIAV